MSDISPSVLILDDDPIFQAVTSALLRQRLGLTVVVAGTVDEGLDIVKRTSNLDLIVCDLNLPDADGIEFASAIAKNGIRCPILFVSSAVKAVAKGAGPLAKSFGLTVVDTMRKPLDQEAFVLTVAGALGRSG